jgi:hypothetical protein
LNKNQSLLRSTKALAIPVTYLILFVSFMAIISVTYSFAVVKINARGSILKASVAKQNMLILDDAVHSVAWGFGASETVYMDDCGGTFQTQTGEKYLVLNLTDEQSFNDVVFNNSLGEVFYELEPSEFNEAGFFIRGDDRPMVNQSTSTMTQLYVTTGQSASQIVLCYRPLATVAVIGSENGKPLNLIRINIINLNSSRNLMLRERVYLRITSLNVTTSTRHYEFNQSISSLALKTDLDGTHSTVRLPISSNPDGAVVELETVVCSVRIQRVET